MKKFLISIIKDFIASLNNRPGGFSLRRLCVLVIMVCIVWVHFKYVDVNNAVDIITYDMIFILALFGIVTFDKLYQFKNTTTTNTTNNNNSNEVEK